MLSFLPFLMQVGASGASPSPLTAITLYSLQYVAIIAVVLIFWWILRNRIREMTSRFREAKPLAIVVMLVGVGLFLQGYTRAQAVSGSGGGVPNVSNPMATVGVVVFCTGLAFLIFSASRRSSSPK